MNRADVLNMALQAVTVDRVATHGAIVESFGVIAKLWSARLGVEVLPHHVAIMLVDLKTVRGWTNPKHADNWVDIAGYAAIGGEMSEPDATSRPDAPRSAFFGDAP